MSALVTSALIAGASSLAAAGGWMIVCASLAFEFGVVYHNTLLAFCWVIASVGSWVLERTQNE